MKLQSILPLFLFVPILAIGCKSVTKDYSYMAEREYQQKPRLKESVILANEPMSEKAVQQILNSKVSFPKSISLAVVRLAENNPSDFQAIDESLASQFYNKAAWGARVRSVIPMPQIMIGTPVSIAGLRQAAVLLQADALLIVKPISFSDYKIQLFEKNKAKGTTSLEVLLMDTRTGVFPYTSVITETVELLKENSDYSDYEMSSRARKESESKALLQVPAAIQKFISKAM